MLTLLFLTLQVFLLLLDLELMNSHRGSTQLGITGMEEEVLKSFRSKRNFNVFLLQYLAFLRVNLMLLLELFFQFEFSLHLGPNRFEIPLTWVI
jgi:hypothetical protein